MALQGAGTEVDPWLITTMAEFVSVVRTSGGSGYYRIANELDNDSSNWYSLPVIQGTALANYSAKVIDGDGFGVRFASVTNYAGVAVLFSGVHFRNIRISFNHRYSGYISGYSAIFGYRCSFTDVAISAELISGYAYSTSLISADDFTPSIIPRDFSRVLLQHSSSPALSVTAFYSTTISGVFTWGGNYYYSANSSSSNYMTRRTVAFSLATLDALAPINSFSDAGWWQDNGYMLPWQAETVTLTLQVVVAAESAIRRLWLESERTTRYLGESDASGAAQFTARIRKHSGFAVLASDDFGADDLRADKAIAAGYWYLPPSDNGFVYQADIAGRITSLDGVTFADQPVLVDGITFTPRPLHAPAMSPRRSVARNGATQQITLNNAGGGGGGPVIEGDPAYLEGVVEEVHPLTGIRRALTGCEVIAFERRGSGYVAMGSTYSDGIGGFRLETQVYGGGDVFAFAADFPGVIFQSGATLNIGDRIRPALANGYVYEVTEAGTAGAEEPVWWPDQGDGTEGDIGTARARARPYYQPVGHGPLKMTPM